MNVRHPIRMDKPAFLAFVQGRDERFELDRGRVVMMTGGSRAHWQITANIFKSLDAQLDADKWVALPEFGVDLGLDSVRYPDVVVDVAGQPGGDLAATSPVLIVEVLSPSSARVDLGDKAAQYLGLTNLAAYLVFAQDEIKAWVWIRGAGGFASGPEMFEGDDAVVAIGMLGVALPLHDVYARVALN